MILIKSALGVFPVKCSPSRAIEDTLGWGVQEFLTVSSRALTKNSGLTDRVRELGINHQQ